MKRMTAKEIYGVEVFSKIYNILFLQLSTLKTLNKWQNLNVQNAEKKKDYSVVLLNLGIGVQAVELYATIVIRETPY
ncbi:MAG: hypothetical protein A3F72_03720 [Bacteroidetes bacterium RIFCSPLOWO2_12_FULL_35_15]|nr:MAG: hypothetical protein A3F72_03720 [Bacteroidetes bacterium RIFCSPLOWO2_12_FULL_35_15]